MTNKYSNKPKGQGVPAGALIVCIIISLFVGMILQSLSMSSFISEETIDKGKTDIIAPAKETIDNHITDDHTQDIQVIKIGFGNHMKGDYQTFLNRMHVCGFKKVSPYGHADEIWEGRLDDEGYLITCTWSWINRETGEHYYSVSVSD